MKHPIKLLIAISLLFRMLPVLADDIDDLFSTNTVKTNLNPDPTPPVEASSPNLINEIKTSEEPKAIDSNDEKAKLTENNNEEKNKDLVYKKEDKQTPSDINDDHVVVRKINEGEQNSLAVSGGNIYFEHDKANVVPTEHIKIEEISKAILKLNQRVTSVLIEGFASLDGDSGHNLNLGIDRANAVKKALIDEGIPELKIKILSFGDKKPFRFENKNKNRRVQIRLLVTQN